jgi:NAD(P)H-dependent flavin oxidoreductase YrpB (nitropropane dioxygenase family)
VHPSLNTRLCETFGVRYPVIQTAMGWVATPELVAGTANAGGMGFLAVATLRADEAERAIARTKELTDKPFGVNFLMEQPGAAEIAASIVRHGVKAASYSRSPRREFIDNFKAADILCVPTVGAPRHAVKAVELGADIIVCQGGEGGGHTGSIPTSLLLPQVVDAVDVPVAAAGGFHDGRGLVAALSYGADGIAMGTRFLLTEESPVPRTTLERYHKAGLTDVQITVEVDGLPQRCIRNEFLDKLEAGNTISRLVRALRSGLEYRKLSGASIPELMRSAFSMQQNDKLTRTQMLMAANAPIFIKRAMVEGHPADGVLPSGQVAGVIDDLPTCEELIERIIAEAEHSLDAVASGKNAKATKEGTAIAS